MWISKQISKDNSFPVLQIGKSAVNSSGGTDAVSTVSQRNIEFYSPYGYRFLLPQNMNVLLAGEAGKQYGIGVLNGNSAMKPGEIKITAESGACIYLKADGSVEINGLKITKDGVIE